MKLNSKHLLAILLSVLMVVGMLTTFAFAADGETTFVAQTGDVKYATLAEAIAAANAGDTITFLADITEDVTINKSLTIDGANFKYTGKMTGNDGLTVTVQNVNFVNGGFDKSTKSAKGTYTIKNCNFDGEGKYAYSLHFRGANKVTVEDCTVSNYMYSFLYINSGANIVSVKDVTVENCPNYAVYFSSGVNTATFENLSVKNSNNGFIINNTANRAFTIDKCVMENVTTAINHSNGTNAITCTALGINDFGTAALSEYVKVVANAKIGGTYYVSVAEAFAAAKDGDEVEILVAGTYKVPTGKNITITGKVDGVKFDMSKAVGINNASMTFNNVTFEYGNANYVGLQHAGTMVYNNCTINGQVFLYGTSETFNNCTFTQTSANAYNVWTYGAKKVAFNNCIFNSAGKSVLVYTETKTATNDITVTDCDFIASSPADGKAAIEIDTSLSAGATITIDADTTATGFANGNVSGNSLWNNKKGNSTEANNDITVVVDGVTVLAPITFVAQIGDTTYKTLADAIKAATAGQTITFLADITEDVTINKSLTIDGAGKTYTGKMNLTNKANITIKNVNFDGKGYNGYAVETRGANNVTIEDCTAKNYGYGFVQLVSANNSITVKNVTVSNMNYGIKVDYSNAVVLENVDINAAIAAVLNSNYGEKTITIKNSKLNILGTWKRKDTTKTTYVFEGDNTVGQFKTEAVLDNFKLAAGATLTAPEGITVTTDVEDSEVAYADGTYKIVEVAKVAKIGDTTYKTLAEAIAAATAGDTITFLADITEDVTINKSLTIDGAGKTYTGKMNLTNKANITIKNVNFDGKGYNGYAVETRDVNNVTIEDCTAKNYGYGFVQLASATNSITVKNVTVSDVNYGIKIDRANTVVIENANITAGVAAIYNSNYGKKTITIKDSELNIIKTWKRNDTTKTTYEFEGANTIDQFVINEAIDNFELAADATLTAPEGIAVTTNVEGKAVQYEDGKYIVKVDPAYGMSAKIGDTYYATLADAIAAAKAGDTITFLADITENVTIDKNLTIDGAGKTYTGNMNLTNRANITIKNVNFDGKGYNGYAVETRGATYLTIEDCTAKNYGYGFVQLASGTALTTVKNVTVSNVNYGIKVDYSNAVVIENANIDAAVAAVLNSNYGEKTITIKNSKLSILGTWTRNNTINTTYVFEGANTIDQFVIDAAIDNFELAKDATLTAPNEITVTTNVDGYEVAYENGVYKLVVEEVEPSATIVAKEASLLYRDIVQLRYKFEITGTFNKAYLLIWDNKADAEARNMETAIVKELTKNGPYYVGDSDGIAAKNMGDLQYIVGKVETENGDSFTKVIEYSPLKYANYFKNDPTEGPLVNALMAYGAAAQIYFDYKTDTLMSEGFTVPAYDATKLLDKVTSVTNNGNYGITAKEVSLVFAGAVEYKFKFAIDATAVGNDWKMAYEFADGTTGIVELVQNGNFYTATVPGRGAKDMDQIVNVVVYYGDTAPSDALAVSYNAHDYVRTIVGMPNQSESMKNLAKQFLMYIIAADTRLGNN